MERKSCPRCGEPATIGLPFTLRAGATGVEQLFVVVACRGKCLAENGTSPRHKGRMCREFRFRHALEPISNLEETDAIPTP